MARSIVVFPDASRGKKNGWNWHVAEPSRKVKGDLNVLYTAQGYDSKAIAQRQANAHNKTLKKPLMIYTLG